MFAIGSIINFISLSFIPTMNHHICTLFNYCTFACRILLVRVKHNLKLVHTKKSQHGKVSLEQINKANDNNNLVMNNNNPIIKKRTKNA